MSMQSTFLTNDEIYQLTGRIRKDCQIRALVQMGIEHKIRPDGSVAVLRDHLHKVMGGSDVTLHVAPDPVFNWGALNA